MGVALTLTLIYFFDPCVIFSKNNIVLFIYFWYEGHILENFTLLSLYIIYLKSFLWFISYFYCFIIANAHTFNFKL